jgi:hypothetical protein
MISMVPLVAHPVCVRALQASSASANKLVSKRVGTQAFSPSRIKLTPCGRRRSERNTGNLFDPHGVSFDGAGVKKNKIPHSDNIEFRSKKNPS